MATITISNFSFSKTTGYFYTAATVKFRITIKGSISSSDEWDVYKDYGTSTDTEYTTRWDSLSSQRLTTSNMTRVSSTEYYYDYSEINAIGLSDTVGKMYYRVGVVKYGDSAETRSNYVTTNVVSPPTLTATWPGSAITSLSIEEWYRVLINVSADKDPNAYGDTFRYHMYLYNGNTYVVDINLSNVLAPSFVKNGSNYISTLDKNISFKRTEVKNKASNKTGNVVRVDFGPTYGVEGMHGNRIETNSQPFKLYTPPRIKNSKVFINGTSVNLYDTITVSSSSTISVQATLEVNPYAPTETSLGDAAINTQYKSGSNWTTVDSQYYAISGTSYILNKSGIKVKPSYTNRVYIQVVDSNNTVNQNSPEGSIDYVDVTVNSTPAPKITYSTLPSSTTSSSVTWKGTVTPGSGASISSVKVYNSNTGTTKTATVSGTSWSVSVSLGSGKNTLTATATQSDGQTATCSDWIKRVSLPTIDRTTLPASTSAASVTFKGTYTVDSTLSVSSIKVYNDNTGATTTATYSSGNWSASINLGFGRNNLTATITDSGSNTDTCTDYITRKAVNPTLSVTAPSSDITVSTSTSSYTVTGSATAGSSDYPISSITVNSSAATLSGSGTTKTFSKSVSLSYGANTIKIVAKDSYGSTATITRTITREYPGPSISFTSPEPNLCTNVKSLTISGTVTPYSPSAGSVTSLVYSYGVNDGGAQPTVSVTLGAENSTTKARSFSFTFNLSEGKTVFVFTAGCSNSGNTTATRTVYFSTFVPSLTMTQGTSESVYETPYTFGGSYTMNTSNTYIRAVVTTSLYVFKVGNSSPTSVSTLSGSGSKSFTTNQALTAGENTFVIYAEDNFGNRSTSYTYNVTYKNLSPYCNVTVPWDGIVTDVIEMREFECIAGSPDKIKALHLYENGSRIGTVEGDDVGNGTYYEGKFTLGIQTDVEGRNEYYIQMEDLAGNTANSTKFYVTYSTKKPSITLVSPSASEISKKKVSWGTNYSNGYGAIPVTFKVNPGASYLSLSSVKVGSTSLTISNPTGESTFTANMTASSQGYQKLSDIITVINDAGASATMEVYANAVCYKDPNLDNLTLDSSNANFKTNVTVIKVKTTDAGNKPFAVDFPSGKESSSASNNTILDSIASITLTSGDGYTIENVHPYFESGQTGNVRIGDGEYKLVNVSNVTPGAPRLIPVTITVTTTLGGTATKQGYYIGFFSEGATLTLNNTSPIPVTNKAIYTVTGSLSNAYVTGTPNITNNLDSGTATVTKTGDKTYTFSDDVSIGDDGLYTVKFNFTDDYGNFSEQEITIRKFTQPPLIQISSPIENLITNNVSEASRIIGTTKPAATFVSMGDLTINGVRYTLNTLDEDNYYLIDKTISTIVEGPNTITIIAKDSIGNTATVVRHVRLDTKPPIISDVETESISVDTNGIIHVTLRVTDPD